MTTSSMMYWNIGKYCNLLATNYRFFLKKMVEYHEIKILWDFAIYLFIDRNYAILVKFYYLFICLFVFIKTFSVISEFIPTFVFFCWLLCFYLFLQLICSSVGNWCSLKTLICKPFLDWINDIFKNSDQLKEKPETEISGI